MGLSASAIIQSHSACWDRVALLRLVKSARFISLSELKPLMKGMSCAGNSPAEFLQIVLDWIMAHVDRSDEILRIITRDIHAIESESRVQTTAAKFGINCR